jgi:hypothetical protein
MPLVVADGGHQRLGRQQRRLDGVEPALEAVGDGRMRLLAMLARALPDEAELLRLLLLGRTSRR